MIPVEKIYDNFFVRSTVSKRLNMVFSFLRDNYKEILVPYLYIALPICLFLAFLGKSIFYPTFIGAEVQLNGLIDGNMITRIINSSIVGFIGSIIAYLTVTKVFIRKNNKTINTDREVGVISSKDIVLKVMILFAFSVLITAVIVLLMILLYQLVGWFVILFAIPLLIIMMIVSVSLFITYPIYIIEGETLIGALKKSYKYSKKTWGSTFLLYIVLSVIGSVISGVASVPYVILEMVKNIGEIHVDSNGMSTTFIIFSNLSETISLFFSMVVMVLPIVGMIYQYGHSKDVTENISQNKEIENFDTL